MGAKATRRVFWTASILLFLSVVTNYVDRSNLSVAAPLLQHEFGLSPSQLGGMLSAFFWSYALCQLAGGWLIDRFDPNWMLAAGFLLWSLVTAATSWVKGFEALLAMRVALGVAESIAYPAYSAILSTHFSENDRGLVNAVIDIGTKIGPALGTLAGGLLMAQYGWRPFFLVLGLAALPWIPCWLAWAPRPVRAAPTAVEAYRPSLGDILRRRSAWATFVGMFSANYFWYFMLTWLPTYLVADRHLSVQRMAVVGTLPFLAAGGATALAGLASYRAIAAGVSPTTVRKICTGAGLGLASIVVFVPAIENLRLAMGVLFLAAAFYGVFASSHWAITQTIAGPGAVGRWTGMQCFTGNLSGVIAPILTGFAVKATGHFSAAFLAVGVVLLVGAACFIFVLGPVEPLDWKKSSGRSSL